MLFKHYWANKNFVSKNIHYYDRLVNKINCQHVWKCSERYIINHYRNNISHYHLEIGPGSGYFLKKENLLKNPSIDQLTLIDINSEILDFSKENLTPDYCNDIVTLNFDIFSDKIPSGIKFNSVGLNYVLHCIPGKLENKLDTLLDNLDHTGYNLFGATVICDPLHMNPLAEYELMLLNTLGIFNNNHDSYEDLSRYLLKNNIKHNISKRGYVALFSIEV